jgi:hypothetical protein
MVTVLEQNDKALQNLHVLSPPPQFHIKPVFIYSLMTHIHAPERGLVLNLLLILVSYSKKNGGV